MNGQLHNNNKTWRDSFNNYQVTFKDGTIKYTRARRKFDAEENVRWFGDEDHFDDIVEVKEI